MVNFVVEYDSGNMIIKLKVLYYFILLLLKKWDLWLKIKNKNK